MAAYNRRWYTLISEMVNKSCTQPFLKLYAQKCLYYSHYLLLPVLKISEYKNKKKWSRKNRPHIFINSQRFWQNYIDFSNFSFLILTKIPKWWNFPIYINSFMKISIYASFSTPSYNLLSINSSTLTIILISLVGKTPDYDDTTYLISFMPL